MNRLVPSLRALLLATVIALAPFGAGCVDDQGLVNRTDVDKIDKTMLEGVWIYSVITVDAPYSSATSFVGHQNFGAGSKVLFDVTEDHLIAYSVMEAVDGSEEGWKSNSIRKYWDPDNRDEFQDIFVGQPVAMWEIDKHFDVIRNYSTYTGAQGNALTENTTDRPWYERDYIRVDWASQSIGQFFHGLSGGIGSSSYHVGQDKAHEPNGMVIDADGGYFDYTVRTIGMSAGQWACSVYGLTAYDCADTMLEARHSFLRLDPRRDYEPIRYHNNEHQDKFGYFLTDRYSYDSDWGPTYEGKVSFANRWNIWDKTYDFIKPTGAEGEVLTVDCFSDIDCHQEEGERCQKTSRWFETGYCAMPTPKPMGERGLRPIIYHMNMDWHPDYLTEAYTAADGWSDVFRDAVAWALFYDEMGQGSTKGCDAHADCANADLLADVDATVSYPAIPCHTNGDCGSAVCAADGYCAMERPCAASNPCALGQTCQGGFCYDDAGEKVVETLSTIKLRGSTLIYAGQDNTILTHDNFSTSQSQDASMNASVWVRFVHAAPEGGDLGLTVSGVVMAGGAFDDSRDYDPSDPATADFMALVPGGSGVQFKVISGGTEVATRNGDLVAGNSYTIIYNGTDIIVAADSFQNSNRGVRLVHASAGEAGLDFGVEGVRLAQDLGYGESTSYGYIAGKIQRATVTRTGARGDITCYKDDDIGRCVGWGFEFNDTHQDRVDEILAGLPEMFVLCENSYDSLDALVTVADTRSELSDARYTYTRDGALYNPCGDPKLVAHPESTKRIGDIRYSYFNWINEAQRSGPLGYGPSIADPDTGQLIVGNANIYGGSMHTYGQYAADIIDLVNGDLDTEDVIIGQHIREYFANKKPEPDPTYSTYKGGLVTADALADVGMHHHGHHNVTGHQPGMQADITSKLAPATRMAPERAFPELFDYMAYPEKFKADLAQQLPQMDASHYHDRLALVEGTEIEAMLINEEVKLAAPFIDPFGEMDADALMEALSPTSWASKYALQSEEARMRWLAKHNLYMGEFVDDAIYGIAKEVKAMGLWGDSLRLEVSRRILGEVLEHEVGHTVGLRHNFSGSTDVFNFFDEYYATREREVILCQDDEWCDEITGELCAIQECAADGDCIVGMLCVAGECSAPSGDGSTELVATGVCARPIEDLTCASDGDCGEGNICQNNECKAPSLQFVPRPWLTDNEKNDKRTEYQYTTVMDYGGRFNTGIHGMGKYDYAAIRFAYTGLVDTYQDPSNLFARANKAASLYGQTPSYWSFYVNTRWWPTRGTGFWHPFNYLSNYIGIEENMERLPRPYEQVKYQRQMVVNDVRRYIDLAHIEVPYAFCSDEFRGNMGCYYFDMGIDAGEMGGHAAEQLEQYYIFDAFRRGRLYYGSYGNPMGYYGRIMDRYLRVLGDVGMYAAMWDNFLFRYSWYQGWVDSPMGGRTLRRAANTAFGYLKDVVSSPAPGTYRYDELEDAYVNVNFEKPVEGSDDLYIPFGVGRYPYTQFGDAMGYMQYKHPLWFGSFWEKLGALVTLTDSTAYFVDTSVGEQLNIGVGTSLGFNTLFSEEMANFLGGVISADMDFYAGRVVQGQYYGPSVPGRQSQDVNVEPGLNNFTLKLYSALLGLANLPAGYDPAFIDRLAVYLEGEASHFVHEAPGVVEHRFVDPIGGKVYVAYTTNYADYGDPKVDVGVNLVDQAQGLADAWDESTGDERAVLEVKLQEMREVLDLLRRLNHVYGASALGF